MKAFHRFFARLHGGSIDDVKEPLREASTRDLATAYNDYAVAVANANTALRFYGESSREFKDADIAAMRLFHRVKRTQGLGPRVRQD